MDLDNLNAPQFVDFTKPLDYEEDNYFDFDHEKGGRRLLMDDPFKVESSDSIYDDAKENEDDMHFELASESLEPSAKIPKNLCTSLDDWRKGGKPKTPPVKAAVKAAPVRRSPRVTKSATNSVKNEAVATKKDTSISSNENSVKRPSNISSNTEAPKRSRTRSAADRSLPVKSESGTAVPRLKRTGSFRGNFRANHSRTESKEVDHSVKITMPKTPECLKRETKTVGNKILKSTSERELQNAQDFKKALAQKRKLNEKYRLKAMAATAVLPKRENKTLTKPEQFHFKTDDRLKSHGMETRQDGGNDCKDYTSSLRSHHPASPKPVVQRTKVQPFSFDRKRKRPSEDGEGGQFKSMAEMVQKFSNQTPDRFRKRGGSKDRSPTKRRRRSMSQPHLTLPKTPNLQTRVRARPANVKSYEELQEEEYEQHKKQQFKAQPVNEKIFDKKYAGVKKAPPRALTHPVTPQLELRRREATWRDRSEHEEESYEFHANPVPKSILDGPTGVKAAQQLPLTVPASPAFALRNRVANIVKEQEPEPEAEARSLRGRPIPKFGVPFKPKLETKVTEPRPFSFAERMRADQQKKEEKIMKLNEEKNQSKEFHANPIPDLSPELPPKQVKPATRPKPFLLGVDVRGQAKAEEWSNKIKEELKSVREQAKFKAKPSKVVAMEPFIPKKSNKPLTDVNELQLNTEKRIEERVQWEKWRNEKEQEKEELEMQRQKMKEQEERENERQLRKQMEPKAKPIRKYREMAIKSSDKPLTQPHSPQFAKDRTLRRSMRC